MTDDILRIRDFSPALTEYSKLETNTFGGKKMWVNYQGRKKFTLQLPRMHAPFGVSEFQDPTSGKIKYSLPLSFNKQDEMKGVIKMFHDKLTEWDEKVVDDASNNTVSWFKKPAAKLTKNAVRKNYTPMLAKFKDKNTLEFTGEYPDKVKLKIPFWEGKFAVEVYDENQQRVDISYIKPNCEIIAVVKSSNVWISADKFGVCLNAGVLQVFPPERLTGYSFLPDLESQAVDETPLATQSQSQPSVVQTQSATQSATPVQSEATQTSVVQVPVEEESKESSTGEEENPESGGSVEQPKKEDDIQIQSESDDEQEQVLKEEKKASKRAPPARATGGASKKTKGSALDNFKGK